MKLFIAFTLLCLHTNCVLPRRLHLRQSVGKLFTWCRSNDNVESDGNEYNRDYRASQKLVNGLKEAHANMDYNGDKKLTPEEIINFLNKMIDVDGKRVFHITKEDAVKMVKEGDLDGNGELTEVEWVKMFLARELKKVIVSYTEGFGIFDKNEDKSLTTIELQEILIKLRVKDARQVAELIVDTLDCDGNKELNFEEFLGLNFH